MENELRSLMDASEKLLYECKPNRKCHFFESVFNRMLPIAIIWSLVDLPFLLDAIGNPSLLPFMLLHLMPVWLYLVGVIFAARKYRNTQYAITDRAVYISGGIFNRKITVKPFAELSRIELRKGIFDKFFHAADIVFVPTYAIEGSNASLTLANISDYQTVYNLVKKLQMDIYSDVMYPNAMRPNENK